MTKTFLSQVDATQWLDQFDAADRTDAAKLLALVRLVPSDLLRAEFIGLLEDRLARGKTPVGLFNESERRKWKGKPNRLFKEKKRANPAAKGKKIARAYGNAGPPLVPRQHYVDEEIGSEGVMANILTQFWKTHRQSVILSPGPDRFRRERIRRFILNTDFIGSGKRVEDYLNAAWRLGSVRSWWSRRGTGGLHFEVVAYAGTDEGIARVEKHPCQPQVFVVTRCPTIRTVFLPAHATVMEDLCTRYAPPGSEAFGFSKVGALLAFGHGMPNNAPVMFWKSTPKWRALFPERTTISTGSPFSVASSETLQKERLELASETVVVGPPIVPVDVETIVLSALRRSPRHAEAVSGRLGLDLPRVHDALKQIRQRGWIDEHQQLTERGRLVIKRLVKSETQTTLPKRPEELYFPESLRMPRDV